jgi:biotin carboxyl carrier protein
MPRNSSQPDIVKRGKTRYLAAVFDQRVSTIRQYERLDFESIVEALCGEPAAEELKMPQCSYVVGHDAAPDETTQPERPARAEPTRLQVFTLQPSPVDQVYEASGTVRAGRQAVLASKLQGSVLAVPVQLGSRVQAGQLLVELDHGETDAVVSRAQAAVKAAGDGFVREQRRWRLLKRSAAGFGHPA